MGEGQRKDLEESGTDLSDLHSLTSSCWMGRLRELWEESGLQLPQGQFSWVPLGLWEWLRGLNDLMDMEVG